MSQAAQTQPSKSSVQKGQFKFNVSLSKEDMVAHLIIEPQSKDEACSITIDELVQILNESSVVYGINREQLGKIANDALLNKAVEVARGKPPGKGRDAGFELLFETAGSKAPAVGDDGYIDYKSLNLISNATKGQPLAKKIAPGMGEPGMTVKGKELPGEVGKDRALPKGKNTDVSPDNPDLLIATQDGAITFANNLVSIDNVYKISSDVDMSTGNIDFVGSLKISGMVKAGFKVKAAGNIEIGKNIEDAEIISGGTIVAAGGFVGSGHGVIEAAEDVFVKYVENQNIKAGHDVNIGGGCMNANVMAGNAVILKGAKSIIVGGSVTALNVIEANVVGSEFGTPTLIRVGYNQTLITELKDVEKELQRLHEDGEKIHKAMYSLVRLELDGRLSMAQRNALMQLKEQQVEIPRRCDALTLRKNEIVTKLNENKKAKIIVKQTVYPGTIIQIGILKRELDKVINGCTFGASHDKIVILAGH